MAETLVLQLDSRAMSEEPCIRVAHLADKLRGLVGEEPSFVDDYTVVPIEDGVVVSKREGLFFYDVRYQSGNVTGRNLRPSGFMMTSELSEKTCESLIAGALLTLGCRLELPADHNLVIR